MRAKYIASGSALVIVRSVAHDVFISYSSKDKAAADAACNVLERNGVRVWMAPRDILPGVGWAESLIGAINNARVMVLVYSSNANHSPQIEREVERAINKGLPVVPFRVEDVAPSATLEYFISETHWLDAFPPPLEHHLERLADAVKRLLASKFVQPSAPEPKRGADEGYARESSEAGAETTAAGGDKAAGAPRQRRGRAGKTRRARRSARHGADRRRRDCRSGGREPDQAHRRGGGGRAAARRRRRRFRLQGQDVPVAAGRRGERRRRRRPLPHRPGRGAGLRPGDDLVPQGGRHGRRGRAERGRRSLRQRTWASAATRSRR